MGKFLRIDEDASRGVSNTSMRIRVCIDITRPLMRCMNIEGPRNQPIQLTLKYERLPNFCGPSCERLYEVLRIN